MVSSEQNNVFGVFELVTEEKLNGLYRVVASINKISNEDVSRSWKFPTDFKQFQDVIKLPMDVAADDDWRFGLVDIGLFEE